MDDEAPTLERKRHEDADSSSTEVQDIQQELSKEDKKILQVNRRAYQIIAISLGFQVFPQLSMNFFFKDDLKLDPTALSLFDTLTSWIWLFKPLMGFAVDSFSIFGSKKLSYMVICSFIQIIAWLSLSLFVSNFWTAVACKLMINLASGFINVIGEALMVQLSNFGEEKKTSSAAKNVSNYLSLTALCMLVSSYLGGLLLKYLTTR